jgi:hypothetical protein
LHFLQFFSPVSSTHKNLGLRGFKYRATFTKKKKACPPISKEKKSLPFEIKKKKKACPSIKDEKKKSRPVSRLPLPPPTIVNGPPLAKNGKIA